MPSNAHEPHRSSTSLSNTGPSRWLIGVAFACYSTVMIALTMLKALYRIGYLWDPARQHRRDVSLELFGEFSRGDSWFAPIFGYVGNVAFFIPCGVLIFAMVRYPLAAHAILPGRADTDMSGNSASKADVIRTARLTAPRGILVTAIIGMLFSLTLEVSQYVFSLGLSDIDDVLMNTIGALVGALIAAAADKLWGPRVRYVWVWLAILLGVVFAILVGLGERLGDPNKVVQVN